MKQEKEITPNTNSNLTKLINAINKRLENERCTIYAGGRKELAKEYIGVVQMIAAKLDCEAIGIGSVFNNIGQQLESQKPSDIDFSIVPNSDPMATAKKMKDLLKTLPRMTKRAHKVDVEADRQYTAYNINGNGRIALVVITDKKGMPVLQSLRLVDMNMKDTWTTTLTEGNPTKNNPIIEIGFPPYDENTKTWLDPRRYNPTQKFVGVFDGNKLKIEPCDHSEIEREFPKLTQKSQAILTLRLFAESRQIPKNLNLNDFKEVAPQFYDFMYNIKPCINKMDISTLIVALTNEEFMNKVFKYTFPYIYKVIMSFNRPYGYLAELFKTVNSESLYLNSTKLISLAVQKEIILHNPKDGDQRDIAANIGGVVERSIFDFKQNRLAYDEICESDRRH